MVLFKRKPVQYLEKPVIEDEDVEVWEIEETGEIFTDYEQYLNRMDFYKQRRFICQITGHSGLDFLSALRSERAGAREVEEAFPEALKGPILRRVQFQTISRIDNLVDLIYEEFKADYYPGEAVTVHVVTGEKLTGTVRDKSRFGPKVLSDGTVNPAFSRYFVSLDNRPTEEAVVDDAHIIRDRKIFTKQVLRSFIKKTVSRDAWTGAPWLVKEDVAQQYHIDTRVPPHLRYENKAAERKQNQAHRKSAPDYDGMVGSFSGVGPQQKLPELKPAPKSHKSKQVQQTQPPKTKQPMFLNPAPQIPGVPPQQYMQGPPQHFIGHPQQNPFQSPHYPPNGVPPPFSHFPPPNPSHYGYPPLVSMPQLPPPPPPIKYPIEDLQIAPVFEARHRPALKFFSQDTPVPVEDHPAKGNGILMESVGPLLESWDTLNVYCEVFRLDSFTFDDFVEAMQFTSEDVECELFVEAHCAALKQLVSSESEGGKVQIQLPEMEDDSDEEDSTKEVSILPTPTPEPEPKPKGRTTRSSVQKSDVEAMETPAKAKSPTVEPPKTTHRASEMQADRDWIDRLKKREFKDGGWEIIIVGLLYQLSKKPSYEKMTEPILRKLAPIDMEPTPATAKQQYATLDVNLRIKALQIICMLTAETRAVRAYMEECSEQMTAFRKEKIQWQRDRKVAMEELRLLNEERKILLPANMAPSPEPQPKPDEDVRMGGVDDDVDENEDEIMDTDGETPKKGRSLRRANDRAAERQRKREAEQERKEKAEAAAKAPKQSKQFIKILKDIQKKQDLIKQCEDEIAVLDNDLREADCPRTRVLGKDRFWNRYYWFERNGMPYAGLPNSSTADAGYANGCLWVQGPDDIEREGFIETKPEWEQEYRHRFNMSVRERKIREEGPTSVFTAHQWGYYDDPAAVEALVTWLDLRGSNENKLRKEMLLYKDKIIRSMEKRKEYLHPSEEKKEEAEGSKRMSTRTKHVVETQASPHRFLNWRNTTALKELGHLHSEQPPKPAPSSRKSASKKKEDVRKEKEVVVVEERETRNSRSTATGSGAPKGRSGKPLGRQGTRYDF